jgi:acyl-CoA synthetase (AMP-forming)/AMP-acid ligase II
MASWLRALATRHGARELLAHSSGRLDFAEAEARSALLARALLAAGVGKGSRVGLLMPNRPAWALAFFATTRIGAVAVPINTFFRTRELAWVLRHADVQVLLTTARFQGHDYLARLEEAAPGVARQEPGRLHVPELPFLRAVFAWGGERRPWAGDGEALAAGRGVPAALDDAFLRAAEAQVAPADPAATLYSSGSTADPKGAMHSHAGLLGQARRLAGLRDLGATDRAWSPMPFFWVGGLVYALLTQMTAGACTLCEDVFEPGATLAFLERERATLATGWPHFGKALAEHPSRASRDLSALRAGNLPGLLPPELAPPDPALRANALGMTETCGPHTWGGEGRLPESQRGTFGRPVPGAEHKIVDPETGERLPPGRPGEICVRGAGLMLGLHKVEREATFDAEGFYHTGDGGFFDAAGLLHFTGRLGEMIKTGGANVTPSEVEGVLTAWPEVKAAFVVGLPDTERGQSVAAAVVLEPGARMSADELRERLRGELAAYKVPRHLLVTSLDALPFTDSGKIDKRRLAQLLAERIPGR